MFAWLTSEMLVMQDVTVGGWVGNRDEICKRFGHLLARRRTEARMSQEAFAKAVGLSRTSITNIERGRQPISLHTLYTMADILGVDAGDLLPPAVKDPVAIALHQKSEGKLTNQEREELQKLSAKESNWLQKISKSAPKKTRS
jgi:transcriptional regulator with XRE-family HTH domain